MLTHETLLLTCVLSRTICYKGKNHFSLMIRRLFLNGSSAFSRQVFLRHRILLTKHFQLSVWVKSNFVVWDPAEHCCFACQFTAVYYKLFPDFLLCFPKRCLHWAGAAPCTAAYSVFTPWCRQSRQRGGMSRKWDNNKDGIWLEEIPEVLKKTMRKY